MTPNERKDAAHEAPESGPGAQRDSDAAEREARAWIDGAHAVHGGERSYQGDVRSLAALLRQREVAASRMLLSTIRYLPADLAETVQAWVGGFTHHAEAGSPPASEPEPPYDARAEAGRLWRDVLNQDRFEDALRRAYAAGTRAARGTQVSDLAEILRLRAEVEAWRNWDDFAWPRPPHALAGPLLVEAHSIRGANEALEAQGTAEAREGERATDADRAIAELKASRDSWDPVGELDAERARAELAAARETARKAGNYIERLETRVESLLGSSTPADGGATPWTRANAIVGGVEFLDHVRGLQCYMVWALPPADGESWPLQKRVADVFNAASAPAISDEELAAELRIAFHDGDMEGRVDFADLAPSVAAKWHRVVARARLSRSARP